MAAILDLVNFQKFKELEKNAIPFFPSLLCSKWNEQKINMKIHIIMVNDD